MKEATIPRHDPIPTRAVHLAAAAAAVTAVAIGAFTPDFPTLLGSDKADHVAAMATLSLVLHVASRRPAAALLAALGAGAAVEAVQGLLPSLGHSCDPADLVASWTGALVGAAAARLVRTVRTATSSAGSDRESLADVRRPR